jgi:hypothetical protein
MQKTKQIRYYALFNNINFKTRKITQQLLIGSYITI